MRAEAGLDRPLHLIDGHNLALSQGTGIATYARGMAAALDGLGASHGIVGGADPGRSTRPGRVGGALRLVRRLALRGGIAWRGGLPLRQDTPDCPMPAGLPPGGASFTARDCFGLAHLGLRAGGGMLELLPEGRPPAVMHWTYPTALHLKGAPNLYSVLDLIPLLMPETVLMDIPLHRRLLGLIAARADHIVTISEWSRRDIIRELGVAEDRVTNTWLAVDPDPEALAMPPDRIAALLGRHGLSSQGYFLFFAAIEPRKNLRRLIEAHLASGVAAPLIVVGKKAWLWERELEALAGRENSPDGRVRLLGHLPRAELMALVRGARAACFPSLYEGFGLPALEAMALGTPVLTSTASCMPEVVADAAMCVDPLSVQAMAEALRALDQGAELRARLAAAGPGRAAFFSAAAYRERLGMLLGRLGLHPGAH
ncbi:glycosyltransferase family 4 protein [Rhodovarius crocodyli]|nr:glycosyltransferase family 1 protein [Rhodovarius crocodyli]